MLFREALTLQYGLWKSYFTMQKVMEIDEIIFPLLFSVIEKYIKMKVKKCSTDRIEKYSLPTTNKFNYYLVVLALTFKYAWFPFIVIHYMALYSILETCIF